MKELIKKLESLYIESCDMHLFTAWKGLEPEKIEQGLFLLLELIKSTDKYIKSPKRDETINYFVCKKKMIGFINDF